MKDFLEAINEAGDFKIDGIDFNIFSKESKNPDYFLVQFRVSKSVNLDFLKENELSTRAKLIKKIEKKTKMQWTPDYGAEKESGGIILKCNMLDWIRSKF